MNEGLKIAGRVALGFILAVTPLPGYCQNLSPSPARTKPAAAPASTKSLSRDGYVGSASCSPCHARIAKEFSRTSMGRSMCAVTPAILKTFSPTSLYDKDLDRYFEAQVSDGNLFQSELQLGNDAKEIFRDTHKLGWIIGAGANGFGALLERDHYLFQAPLSFYTKPGAWGLSPGYEFGDYGFNRPILSGCISCHSGRPSPVAATNGRFETKPFQELAIGCENCHGPGAAHIQAMTPGRHRDKTLRDAIVNPANLPMELSDNICMGCHQTGDERIFKPGKTYQDFRPGQPLDTVLSILMVPPDPKAPPQADHLEHFYSMTLSKCYRSSRGKMGCITCHDPHVEPTRHEAPAFFNARCLTCHTRQSCSLAPEARQHTAPADNCIGCHMPKRDVQVISHSSVTSHRILARPDEGLPESAFHRTTAAVPDLIHLNPAPDGTDNSVPPLTLLQAYGELAATRPEYVVPYLKILTQLEASQPENSLVQAALGRRDLRDGNFTPAARHLQRALQLGPDQGTVLGDLAEATTKLGDPEQGLVFLRKATAIDPFNPALRKMLVARLIAMKQYGEAIVAMEGYLETFPQDSYIRKMLDLARSAPSHP